MKMHSKHKRIATVLLSAMVMTCNALSFQAPISTASAAHAALAEDAVPFDSVDGLEEGSYSPDKVIVLLKQAYSRKYNRLLKKIFSDPMFKGYEVLSDPETENHDDFHLFVSADLNSKGADAVRNALDYLQSFDEIYYACPNHLFELEAQFIPNDPGVNKKLGYWDSRKSYELIMLDDAWDITTGSKSVVISNSESLTYTHEDFAGQMWWNPYPTTDELHGANFNRGDRSIWTKGGGGFNDEGKWKAHLYGHGNLTAGIMCAAGNNQKGSAGVAYGTQLMSCQAEGIAQFKEVIKFLNRYNVKVLNISLEWGYNEATDKYAMPEALRSFNGLIVCSAGNSGKNIDTSPSYPSKYSLECPNVIPVTAVTDNNEWYGYNYGVNTVQIAAPADVVGPDMYRPQSSPNALGEYSYWLGLGTSSASPVVAGVAALIYSANPTLNAQQVKNALLNNADSSLELYGKVQGNRLLNAYQSVKSVTVDKGTYFFRSKANGRYLDVDMNNNKLIAHDFNANDNQKFDFGSGALKSISKNAFISARTNNIAGSSPIFSSQKSDIAIAKNMSGQGYFIIKSVRVARNDKEEVDLYALQVNNPSSASSDVVWAKYNPNASAQIWYAEDATPVTLPYGIYKITNASGKVLSLNQSNGKLVQNVSNNGNNQKWEVQPVSGSRYILRTKSTTCTGQIQNVNSTPQVKPSNYVYFSLYKNINDSTGQPDGTYRIHYAGSYWCLRVQNDSSVNNTSVIFDGYRKTSANNYNGSRWTFTKIS